MKLYVWGTGCGAGEAVEKGLKPEMITAFIDSNPVKNTFLSRNVILPEQLDAASADLILVTTRHADQVFETCRQLGISEEKILYLKDSSKTVDRNTHCSAAKRLLGDELLKNLLPRQRLITEPDSLRDAVLSQRNDYIRLATLELLTRRLNSVPGAMAELGVYKGSFAACMNRLLPDRKLYLFDSFQGFEPGEGERETAQRTCTDAFLKAHQNTTQELVLKNMPFPESVLLRPGFFPESLHGLEEHFCLVSLDADFKDSTLEGLRYFFPRLSPGGYLLLHDWGSPRLTGVGEAVTEYEREIGHILPSVPIPDIGNSLIIQKP